MIDLALLILRLGIGVMFFAHGMQMALGLWGGPGVEGFSKALAGMGFVMPLVWSYLAGYTTLLGGACLILGVIPRIASSFLFIFIAVAAFKVDISKGFFLQGGGFEYNFVIACACIAILLAGSGKYSVFNKF